LEPLFAGVSIETIGRFDGSVVNTTSQKKKHCSGGDRVLAAVCGVSIETIATVPL
jgi:hypothetical protein